MQQSTELKQKELLSIQSNAGNIHKPPSGETTSTEHGNDEEHNTELLQRIKIQNAPFEVVGNEEIGYFIAFGKYKLTTNYNTIEEAQQRIEYDKWEIMINLIIIIVNQTELARKEYEKQEEIRKNI